MKIFCIGRNYVDHAKELNNKVPTEPLVFMKPATAISKSQDIPYPSFSSNLQYELELCILISKTATKISEEESPNHFEEIGLGIDYTARDIQTRCKEKGHSWEKAKAFDTSASFSSFVSKSQFDLEDLNFHLHLNKNLVQKGNTKQMIFKINHLIHHVSQYFTLEKGDILMTGTPAGVGPLKIGDKLSCYLNNELVLENLIISR